METLLRGYHMNKKIGKDNSERELDKYICRNAANNTRQMQQAPVSVEKIENNL